MQEEREVEGKGGKGMGGGCSRNGPEAADKACTRQGPGS